MTNLSKWLELVTEDAIEPDLAIVDAHHHCWGHLPPLPELPVYGFEELMRDIATSGHNVIATVYLQAYSHYHEDGPEHLKPVGETEHINTLADLGRKIGGKSMNVCAGIVGWGNFFRGKAVAEELDAHIAAAPDRLKGFRYLTTYDADNPHLSRGNKPGMLADRTFREGISEVAARNLVLDVMVFHPQIPEVTELARAFPYLTIVLNHIGAPMVLGRFADRGKEVFESWTSSMKTLAEYPNVVVKLGGLNSARTGMSFLGRDRPPTSEELATSQGDYIRRTIDLFGPSRCMFESNFPVDMSGASYTVLWNGFKRMVSAYNTWEKQNMFGLTAKRVYRLNLQ